MGTPRLGRRLSAHATSAVVLGVTLQLVGAADNGKARTPPMGWRSWNAFWLDVNQEKVQHVIDAITERTRFVDGVRTSLADLGYTDVGLDDGWQACGAGVNGSFHDADGHPLINTTAFPDMKQFTDYGHRHGLKMGWYMNTCYCLETQFTDKAYIAKHMEGDVKAIFDYGFDGVKLDGCGQFLDLKWWYSLINATGKPMLIENCHWGGDAPPCEGSSSPLDCPYNMWRTSGDIQATWDSMFHNFQSIKAYHLPTPLSVPGTWAYPDMMEVGRMASFEEDRSHFGAWVISSSPLILGHDLRDESTTDRVWDIISNKEAIKVNQAWAGHPGFLAKELTRELAAVHVRALACETASRRQMDWKLETVRSHSTLVFIRSRSLGLCVDAVNPSDVQLLPCNRSSSQTFSYNSSDKQIRAPYWPDNEKAVNGCLDINGKNGPRVQLTRCNQHSNQAFTFSAEGVWADMGHTAEFPARCMEAQHGIEVLAQAWAKPLASGAMAVFVVNANLNRSRFNISLQDDLHLPTGEEFSVRDVWSQKDLPSITGMLSTDVVAYHDSRLYTLTPRKLVGSPTLDAYI